MFVSWSLLSNESKISGLWGQIKRLTLCSFLSCRHHWITWRRKRWFLQKLYMSSLHLWHKPAKTRNCIANTQAPLPVSSAHGGFMAALDADMKWSCSIWQEAMPRPRLSSVIMFLTAQLQAGLIIWRAPRDSSDPVISSVTTLYLTTHQLGCCSGTHTFIPQNTLQWSDSWLLVYLYSHSGLCIFSVTETKNAIAWCAVEQRQGTTFLSHCWKSPE